MCKSKIYSYYFLPFLTSSFLGFFIFKGSLHARQEPSFSEEKTNPTSSFLSSVFGSIFSETSSILSPDLSPENSTEIETTFEEPSFSTFSQEKEPLYGSTFTFEEWTKMTSNFGYRLHRSEGSENLHALCSDDDSKTES